MTVEAVAPTPSLPQTHTPELASSLRSGTTAPAQVIETLQDGTSRLSILGQTIDVFSPTALQTGTSLNVLVSRDASGNLQLVLQGSAPQATAAPTGAGAAPLQPAAPENLSGSVQAAITGALLDAAPQAQGSAQAPPAAIPAQSQPGAAASTAAPAAAPQNPVSMQAEIIGALFAADTNPLGSSIASSSATAAQIQPASLAGTAQGNRAAPVRAELAEALLAADTSLHGFGGIHGATTGSTAITPEDLENFLAWAKASNIKTQLAAGTGLQSLSGSQQAQAAQSQPATTSGAGVTPEQLIEFLFWALIMDAPDAILPWAKAMNTQTLIAADTSSQSPSQQAQQAQNQPASTTASGAAAKPETQVQNQSEAGAQSGLGAASQTSSPASTSQPAPSQAASTAAQTVPVPSQAAAQAPVQNLAPTQVIIGQLLVPQLAEPLPARIERRGKDTGAGGEGEQPAKPTWTVGVSVDAGAMGVIHLGIGLHEGAVSVKASCENPQGVAAFNTWLPELKTTLERANFVAGNLSAVEAPLAGAAHPSRSYTL